MTAAPVMDDKFGRAWPEHAAGAAAVYRELGDALERRYSSDAHTAQWTAPDIPRRLARGAPERLPDGVRMTLAIFDVDDPVAHAERKPARAEWLAAELGKVARLHDAHQILMYATRGGYRLVSRLPAPIVIRDAEDAAAWSRLYLSWCVWLSRKFGIVADLCTDWQHLFRLPHATRDDNGDNGEPEDRLVYGDVHKIGAWPYPFPHAREFDLAEAHRLAAIDPRWASAIGRMEEHVPRNDAASPMVREIYIGTDTDLGGNHAPHPRAYARAALDDEVNRVRNAPEGTRNDALNRAAHALGQLVGAGALDRGDVERALVGAALAAGLGEREAERTIRSGIDAGEKEPRDIPPPPSRGHDRDPDAPGAEKEPPSITEDAPTFFARELDEDDAEDWLIPGLVPRESVTFLAGLPKVMKTFILCEMAIAVASGRPAFGHFRVVKGRVLLFLEEDSRRRIAQRLWALARGHGIDPRLLDIRIAVMSGLRLDDRAWVARLDRELGEHRPIFVGIDALSRVHSSDENDRSSMRAVTTAVSGLVVRHKCSLEIVHHYRKPAMGDEARRPGDLMRGTGDLHALARSVIGISRPDKGGHLVIEAEGNYGSVPPFSVELVEGTNLYGKRTLSLRHVGTASDARTAADDQRVLEALEREPMSTNALCAVELGVPRDRIRAAVRRLAQARRITQKEAERTGPGPRTASVWVPITPIETCAATTAAQVRAGGGGDAPVDPRAASYSRAGLGLGPRDPRGGAREGLTPRDRVPGEDDE